MPTSTSVLLLCGAGALGVTAQATAHEVICFDYGWRFHLGPVGSTPPGPGPPGPPPAPPPPPSACAAAKLKDMFPVNASLQLTGLLSHHAANAEACAAACCEVANKACFTWQFSTDKKGSGAIEGCWIGSGSKMKGKPKQTWVGGSRIGPPPPPPPPPPPSPPSPGDGPDILPKTSPAAALGFDDSKWQMVDLPHDYIIEGEYSKDVPGDQGNGDDSGGKAGGAGQSYLPRDLGFYRKHFHLPSEWKGQVIWIYFEGVFRASKFWLNGQPVREHAGFTGDAHGEGGGVGMGGGYTSFSVRLDNATDVKFGTSEENVLSVYVDPKAGSGWFYEGGGIYRKTFLHAAPPVHIETDGVFARAHVDSAAITTRATPALGATATATATVTAGATIVNTGRAPVHAKLSFVLFDATGTAVGPAASASVAVGAAANSSTVATAAADPVVIAVPSPELWSVARPYLYTLRVTTDGGDSFNTSVGIYATKWTGDQGFYLNNDHVKIRGFCNHESFGGVGMAIPDRVNLFRAQAMRSVGGNGWRMSHNPVAPGLLDVLDRVGVVAMDETRELHADPISIMNMGAMVKRDRNHPSVVIWSYCNEGGCGADGAPQFREITKGYDPTRPTLGNRYGGAGAGTSGMDNSTDVEGFSHKPGEVFDSYHATHPTRPKFASECCSCSSGRSPQSSANVPALQGEKGGESCTAEQSNASNSRPFMAGTMVWTLFDYYGESHGWPKVSSAFGQFDLAGFQKTTARWYRTFWLSAVPASDASRPVGFGAAHSCWPYGLGYGAHHALQVLTDATTVTLYEDGKKTATAQVEPAMLTAASLTPTSWKAKNLTAVCSTAGATTATGTIMAAGNASAIVLSLDAPSVATGTGTHLILDGHDVAMLRATVVDADGHTVEASTANVTFAIKAGPGRVLATHNGDNACHEPNHASWHSAFVGMARAIVQVTEHRTGTPAERARLASINVEVAHATVVVPSDADDAAAAPAASITVVASSPGLASGTVEIPVSDSAAHGVLPTAARSLATEQAW